MRMRLPPTYALLVCCAFAGCESARSAVRQPEHVDSIMPREEALRRFQAGLTVPDGLLGGAGSRDALVLDFVRALESRDSSAFSGLILSRTEFAFLYYPTTPQSLPPYDLSPGLLWFMVEGESRKGLAHALEERGGQSLHYAGYVCEGEVSVQGGNRIWGPCAVRRLRAPGDTIAERLFGPIIERDGRYKFVSFANRL